MTRRERIEARLEARRDWAAGRRGKAAGLLKRNEPFRGDIAFNTQPGHIPERARAIRREDKAFEHLGMAAHHESKAEGLERQLETTIFSDDEDAVERLREKIADLEAQADRIRRYNATARAASKRGEPHGDLAILDEAQRADLAVLLRVAPYQLRPGAAFPAYKLSYLRAGVKRAEERITAIRLQAERTGDAKAAGGVSVSRHPTMNHATVTFAEKPSREVLEALKDAGFWWRGGSWHGPADKLPPGIEEE